MIYTTECWVLRHSLAIYNLVIIFVIAPYLRSNVTAVGELLPLQSSDEPCKNRGGCFVAGDTRVNENTALAAMHTVWVRLHNYYAKEIDDFSKGREGTVPTLSPNNPDRNIIIFEEARKIVIAILQHIFYQEWLPKIVDVPQYNGYDDTVRAEVDHSFVAAAFRFGHTLVRNNFERVNPNFTSAAEGPLSVQASFFNNTPIVTAGIEPIMLGLFGNNSDAEDFDNRFSSSIGERLFISPGQETLQNLAALNIQRGRDHGLRSYTEYRRDLCEIPDVDIPEGSNPFEIFSNTIKNPKVLEALLEVYGSPENHIDFFAVGISEANDGPNKLLGRTFGCILSKTFAALRDGDRFYYENRNEFSDEQQRQVKKMTMAKVMCLTLRDVKNNVSLERIQENLFDVFNPEDDERLLCQTLLSDKLNVEQWLVQSKVKI